MFDTKIWNQVETYFEISLFYSRSKGIPQDSAEEMNQRNGAQDHKSPKGEDCDTNYRESFFRTTRENTETSPQEHA